MKGIIRTAGKIIVTTALTTLLTTVLSTALSLSLFPDDSGLARHLQENIAAEGISSLVETLASPEYEGRLTGTAGYGKAAALAGAHFKKAGLQPVCGNDDYTQSFPISYGKVYDSKLILYFKKGDGKEEAVTCGYFSDYYPLAFSGSGNVTGQIVFAGYGITAPEFNYDDYKGIDVTGKVVLVIKDVPPAKKSENWSPYNNHRFRTKNAKEHGAAAFLYIYAARCNPNGSYLENFPMLSLEETVAERILKGYGRDIKSLKEKLNLRENVSFATDIKAEVMVKSEAFQGTAHNVVGIIPGSDEKLKHEFIVLGTHLDHCGMWPRFTPGADDNASGSAVLMAIAHALGTAPVKPKRSLLFVLFAAEEMGLLGSQYFVDHLPEPVKKIHFMFNMDMVGSGDSAFILRLKNYPEVEEIINQSRECLQSKCPIKGNKVTRPGRAGSDHAPFVAAGIPAMAVFASGGMHHGYHTDKDTVEWLTPKIMESIAEILGLSIMTMAQQ